MVHFRVQILRVLLHQRVFLNFFGCLDSVVVPTTVIFVHPVSVDIHAHQEVWHLHIPTAKEPLWISR